MKTTEQCITEQRANDFFQSVNDEELETMVDVQNNVTIPEDHIIRRFVKEVFGNMPFQTALTMSFPFIAHECLMRMKSYKGMVNIKRLKKIW